MKKVLASLMIPALLAVTDRAAAESHPAPVRHLAQAIQIPTISYQDRNQIDYPAFAAFLDFLAATYPTVFSRLQVDRVGGYSLVMTWPGSDDALRPVLFDAHYDVVPIETGTETDWSHPPFGGVIADGYIWGRGALDDKASVVATLEALEGLLLEGYQPRRTLLFSFAHDEEIGGREGAVNIAKYLTAREIRLEYMVGEGGVVAEGNPLLPEKSVAIIGLAEKTYVTLTLRATGRGGHSSMPVEDNAVVRLAQAVTALHEHPLDTQLVPPVTDMLEVLGEEMGGLQGFLMRNQWFSKPLLVAGMKGSPLGNAMVRSTTAVTMFNAGVKENVISQNAEAKVNFRLLPGTTSKQLLAAVKEIIDDPDIEISSDQWLTAPPVADRHANGYRQIQSAIAQVLPQAVVAPGMLTATTDTPHYADLADNIYRFHPYSLPSQDSPTIHNTDERILLRSVVESVSLSQALIQSAGSG